MKRGDLVTVALQGDFGKPRPALVIQTDRQPNTSTISVLLLTSTLQDAPLLRHTVEPSAENGLRVTSQVQIDRTVSPPRTKVGPTIGRLKEGEMEAITRLLALFFGIA